MEKYISKILTTSLKSLYCQECSNNSDDTSIFTIEIVVGGDHGQVKISIYFQIYIEGHT